MKGRSLLLILALCAVPKAHAQFTSAEALFGNNATTIDLKGGTSLAGKFGFFTRHRLTKNYNQKNGYFGLTDVTYQISKRSNIFVEGQYYSGASPQPKMGVDYNISSKKFSFMTAGTFWNDATLQTISSYQKKSFNARLETFLSYNKSGFAYSIERARVGVRRGNMRVSLGADLFQAPREKTSYNVGIALDYVLSK
jgi:hypothetical protein